MNPMIYVGLEDNRKNAFRKKLMKTMMSVRKSVIRDVYENMLIHLNVSDREIRSSVRTRKLATKRQIVSHILINKYKAKLTEVGRILNRHHATIIYSCDTASDLLVADKIFKTKYNSTINYLKSKGFK